jgi:hypothetical protein
MLNKIFKIKIILITFTLFIGTFAGCIEKESIDSNNKIFDYIPISNNLSNPSETAKTALHEKYGNEWYQRFQIGGHYKYISIPFDHWIIRINQDFCILITTEQAYFLSAKDFNKYLEVYGSNVSINDDQDCIDLFESYLEIFGILSSVQDEEIFLEKHLEFFSNETNIKYNINPNNFTFFQINKTDNYYQLEIYTITILNSNQSVPSSQDILISHYLVEIFGKGQIGLSLIKREELKEAIPAGPK